MDRDLAAQLIRAAVATADQVNVLVALIEKVVEDEQRAALRQCAGNLMEGLYDLMAPILRQHPDLDPYKT
jgi:hypothetical protein